jgi:hypothetical protein
MKTSQKLNQRIGSQRGYLYSWIAKHQNTSIRLVRRRLHPIKRFAENIVTILRVLLVNLETALMNLTVQTVQTVLMAPTAPTVLMDLETVQTDLMDFEMDLMAPMAPMDLEMDRGKGLATAPEMIPEMGLATVLDWFHGRWVALLCNKGENCLEEGNIVDCCHPWVALPSLVDTKANKNYLESTRIQNSRQPFV